MKLLVSVRNLAELEIVAECGVDVIDLKEPSRGPLGQVSHELSSRAPGLAGGRALLSLAMGELIDYQSMPREISCGFQFAKIGLSGMTVRNELADRWKTWADSLHARCSPVVVAYADHGNSHSLPLRDLAEFAVDMRASWFLVDTWSKNGRGLLDWVRGDELKDNVSLLAQAGINTVLAGSLDEHAIRQLANIPAAMVGVRGAVCSGGDRAASVNRGRLRQVLAAVKSLAKQGIAARQVGAATGTPVK